MSNGRPYYEEQPSAYNRRGSYNQYKLGRISKNVGKSSATGERYGVFGQRNETNLAGRPRTNVELNKGIKSHSFSRYPLSATDSAYPSKYQSTQLRSRHPQQIYNTGSTNPIQSDISKYGHADQRSEKGYNNRRSPTDGQAYIARQAGSRGYQTFSSALQHERASLSRNQAVNEIQLGLRKRQDAQINRNAPHAQSHELYTPRGFGDGNLGIMRYNTQARVSRQAGLVRQTENDRQITDARVTERMHSELYQAQSSHSPQTLRSNLRQIGFTPKMPEKQAFSVQNTPSRRKTDENYDSVRLHSQSTRDQLISKSKALKERMNELQASARHLVEPTKIRNPPDSPSKSPIRENEDSCSRLQRLLNRPKQRRCDSPYKNESEIFQLTTKNSGRYQRAPCPSNSGNPPQTYMKKINLFTQEVENQPHKPQQVQQSNYEQLHSDDYMKKINSLSHRINERINSLIHSYDC